MGATTVLINPGDRAADPQELEGVDAMGRGRQKAKQMKVARRLKYTTPETDLEALQRELAGGSLSPRVEEVSEEEKDEYADAWGAGSYRAWSAADAWEDAESSR